MLEGAAHGPPHRPPTSPHDLFVARALGAVSLAMLLLALAILQRRGVDAASVLVVAPLVAAAFVVLIFGTSRILFAGLAGRPLPGGPFAWLPAGLVILGAIGVAGAVDGGRGGTLAWAFLAGMALHGAGVFMALRGPAGPRPPPRFPSPSWPRRVLEAASLVYGIAAGVALPLALAGRWPVAAAMHLLLPGFVTLTIFAVTVHALPRFFAAPFPRPLLAPLAVAGATGPALLAWGLAGGDLRVGAAVESVALASFALGVLAMHARAPRRRATLWGHAFAAGAVLVGLALGLLFAFDPSMRRFVHAHALVMLFGFVGLVVLSAQLDLYAPALSSGLRAARLQVRVVLAAATTGVSSAVAGALLASPMATVLGLALYGAALALQLAGFLDLLARVPRPAAIPVGVAAAQVEP